MKKHKWYEWVIFCIVVLGIFGCGTTAKMVKPDIKDTEVIQAPFDEVWKAVIASLAESALPIKSIEKESGLVTTEFIACSGWDIDDIAQKPSVFLGTWSQGRYTVNIFVTTSGENATKIKITVHIEAFENNLTNSWHVCYSKGVIERRIFASIKRNNDSESGVE